MSCGPTVKTIAIAERVPMFSKGGGTGTGPSGESEVFVLTGKSLMQIAPQLDRVRATLRLENCTQEFEARVVYQLTQDGESWNAPVAITTGPETGGYVSGNVYNTSDWSGTIANPLRGIRFGVICAQKSGTAIQSAWVSVVLDLQLLS